MEWLTYCILNLGALLSPRQKCVQVQGLERNGSLTELITGLGEGCELEDILPLICELAPFAIHQPLFRYSDSSHWYISGIRIRFERRSLAPEIAMKCTWLRRRSAMTLRLAQGCNQVITGSATRNSLTERVKPECLTSEGPC